VGWVRQPAPRPQPSARLLRLGAARMRSCSQTDPPWRVGAEIFEEKFTSALTRADGKIPASAGAGRPYSAPASP
jgi:hypothetical protein